MLSLRGSFFPERMINMPQPANNPDPEEYAGLDGGEEDFLN